MSYGQFWTLVVLLLSISMPIYFCFLALHDIAVSLKSIVEWIHSEDEDDDGGPDDGEPIVEVEHQINIDSHGKVIHMKRVS